jgi:N-acetylmuramoyl-L-alanine amidase
VPTIVLDPGHGGTATVGRSSFNNATGPRGTLEKDLTLDLARRLARELAGCEGVAIAMTRETDTNLGLGERAATARAREADAFVSLHFNSFADATVNGTETWVHVDASSASRALARSLQHAAVTATGLRDRGVLEGRMTVLDPARHHPATRACLIEISCLSNAGEERKLAGEGYRDAIAAGLAGGLVRALALACATRTGFDIWHEVPLVPQVTGMSCWAAAAAMIIGWRDCIHVDPDAIASATGRWGEYRGGLLPSGLPALARAWGLAMEPVRKWSLAHIHDLVEAHGPLWVGEASPGLHSVVLSGIAGDGTVDGTIVRINDPWPIGRGERYQVPFREFQRNLDAVGKLGVVGPQILHAGGRKIRWPSSGRWLETIDRDTSTRGTPRPAPTRYSLRDTSP